MQYVWLNEGYSARSGIFILLKSLFKRSRTFRHKAYRTKNPESIRNINVESILVITHTVYKENIHFKILEWVLTHSPHDSCTGIFSTIFLGKKETLCSQGNECIINIMETNLFCSSWDMLPGEVSFLVHANLHGLGLLQRLDKQQMQWQKCHSHIHYFAVELKQGLVTLICPLAYHLFAGQFPDW